MESRKARYRHSGTCVTLSRRSSNNFPYQASSPSTPINGKQARSDVWWSEASIQGANALQLRLHFPPRQRRRCRNIIIKVNSFHFAVLALCIR